MTSRKKIDLLRVAASDESREIEEQLHSPEAAARQEPFPRDFAASGTPMSGSSRISQVRFSAGRSEGR